jgi:hypothetical protein
MQRSEEREQARFVRWTHKLEVRAVMPELRWLHHSPNGGQRSAFTGAQMTALGVKRGWPDLVLPAPGGGLAIEMKAADGRLSTEQGEWIGRFEACGWTCVVCRSADEARDVTLAWFGVAPDAVPEVEDGQ